MHRFFITPEELQPAEITFSAARSRHIARELRLKIGERCVVLDNQGGEFLVELTRVDSDECNARVIQKTIAEEPSIMLMMLLSLTHRDKFEWMLQKCTEIGASVFQPVITSRSMVQRKPEAEGKYERWRMIIQEAAEQSGRGKLPDLLPVEKLDAAVINTARDYDLCLIPWEREQVTSFKAALRGKQARSVAVFIGPEGGFAEDEVRHAVEAGFTPVTLGKRILRMETAAVAAATLVFHELE